MRSKIAIVLLFMFSFVIAHDTVISVIAEEKPPHRCVHQIDTTHDVLYMQYHQVSDLGQLHAMFHFVALTPLCVQLLTFSNRNKTLSPYQLRYSLYYAETSYKPPIV